MSIIHASQQNARNVRHSQGHSETLTSLFDCLVDYAEDALIQALLLVRDDHMISCIKTFKAVNT